MCEPLLFQVELDNENVDGKLEEVVLMENKVNSQPSNVDHLEVEKHVEEVEICQKTVNPFNRVNAENFNIQRVIGKGGYGKVFLVQKVDGIDKGKLYAMKVLKKARIICDEKDKAHTVSERNILQMLQHPFLVKLHYAFQNRSNLYIVLEYCSGGELFHYLEREGTLKEDTACFYISEIALAIGHLHSLGIIYRDLKSENVLLDRQGHVKLTDFGLSKEGVCTTNTFCGTIEYMAPEIIRCEGHGKAVDWWSLGTLIYDMLTGGPPFTKEMIRKISSQKTLTSLLKFPLTFSLEVISLLRGFLKRDPKFRLGSKDDVEEIKRHKFFKKNGINWSDVFYRRLRPPFLPTLSADNDVSMFDPMFTSLQPIVSPSESSRSLPLDLFQGFSYISPSVCEFGLHDALCEPLSIHDTKQREVLSAAGCSEKCAPLRLTTNHLDLSDFHGPLEESILNVKPDMKLDAFMTNQPAGINKSADTIVDLEVDKKVVNCKGEEDDDENVPGFQHIKPLSPSYLISSKKFTDGPMDRLTSPGNQQPIRITKPLTNYGVPLRDHKSFMTPGLYSLYPQPTRPIPKSKSPLHNGIVLNGSKNQRSVHSRIGPNTSAVNAPAPHTSTTGSKCLLM